MSKIEWTGITWNPTTGCDKISAGCKYCYAEVMSRRLKAMGQEKYKDGFALRIHPDTLQTPYSWKKPQLVFVNSMSDLFHKDVPLDYIKAIFQVMNDTPQHTYQVLTKRADRLALLHNQLEWTDNIWMGVSVENELVASRIDFLRTTNAKTKFLSCEPLIGTLENIDLKGIDWVICGGESGHGARPMHPLWVQKLRDLCVRSDVSFFFKQWGKWVTKDQFESLYKSVENFQGKLYQMDEVGDDYQYFYPLGKHHSGRLLDGREWNEMPKHLKQPI